MRLWGHKDVGLSITFWGGRMRRSNKCECCSRGRSKVIFGPVVLSWRKVYEPGLEEEWGRSGGVGHWAMQHNAAPQPLLPYRLFGKYIFSAPGFNMWV